METATSNRESETTSTTPVNQSDALIDGLLAEI
jgi:hypothetical protein